MDSWLGGRAEPPEIGLAPQRIADVLIEEFDGIPRSGHPLALQPIVVPRSSYRELLGATSALLSLLRKTVIGIGPDRTARMAALAIEEDDCPMFLDDEDFELRHCADMARADVVIDRDGPKFVELNVSGAFGGLPHFHLYQRAWQRIRHLAGEPAFVSVNAAALQARLIESTCRELGVPASAVIVGTPRDWGPDVGDRMFDIQVELLRQHGIHAVHRDFDDVPADPTEWPLGIAAFTVQDAKEVGYSIDPARVALDAGMLLIPSQTAWLLHTKRTLALLSEGQPWMSDVDRELVSRYVPWSRVVGDRRVEWRGRTYSLPALLAEHREHFLLKGATGWSCQEVFAGWECGEQEWELRIEQALRGPFIAQERVVSETYPLDVLREDGSVERISAVPVVSPFGLGGAAAGCYVRFIDAATGLATVGGEEAMRGCLLAEA